MDDNLPSIGITKRFLELCEQYGSQRAAVGTLVQARKRGVGGLPEPDDWTAWNDAEMTAVVEYLQSRDRHHT